MKRQRIYLINRDFQFRYTGAAIVVGILSTAFTTVVLLYPLYMFEILRIAVFVPAPILGVMALAAIINIFFVGMMGIIVTHKIAGPMYSMVRHFRRIEEGQWFGHMRLRDGDELRYLMRNFNEMLNGLIRLAQEDVQYLNNIKRALEVNAPDGAKVQSAHTLVNELSERFQERLNPPALGAIPVE